jgi:hypothetical protein
MRRVAHSMYNLSKDKRLFLEPPRHVLTRDLVGGNNKVRATLADVN